MNKLKFYFQKVNYNIILLTLFILTAIFSLISLLNNSKQNDNQYINEVSYSKKELEFIQSKGNESILIKKGGQKKDSVFYIFYYFKNNRIIDSIQVSKKTVYKKIGNDSIPIEKIDLTDHTNFLGQTKLENKWNSKYKQSKKINKLWKFKNTEAKINERDQRIDTVSNEILNQFKWQFNQKKIKDTIEIKSQHPFPFTMTKGSIFVWGSIVNNDLNGDFFYSIKKEGDHRYIESIHSLKPAIISDFWNTEIETNSNNEEESIKINSETNFSKLKVENALLLDVLKKFEQKPLYWNNNNYNSIAYNSLLDLKLTPQVWLAFIQKNKTKPLNEFVKLAFKKKLEITNKPFELHYGIDTMGSPFVFFKAKTINYAIFSLLLSIFGLVLMSIKIVLKNETKNKKSENTQDENTQQIFSTIFYKYFKEDKDISQVLNEVEKDPEVITLYNTTVFDSKNITDILELFEHISLNTNTHWDTKLQTEVKDNKTVLTNALNIEKQYVDLITNEKIKILVDSHYDFKEFKAAVLKTKLEFINSRATNTAEKQTLEFINNCLKIDFNYRGLITNNQLAILKQYLGATTITEILKITKSHNNLLKKQIKKILNSGIIDNYEAVVETIKAHEGTIKTLNTTIGELDNANDNYNLKIREIQSSKTWEAFVKNTYHENLNEIRPDKELANTKDFNSFYSIVSKNYNFTEKLEKRKEKHLFLESYPFVETFIAEQKIESNTVLKEKLNWQLHVTKSISNSDNLTQFIEQLLPQIKEFDITLENLGNKTKEEQEAFFDMSFNDTISKNIQKDLKLIWILLNYNNDSKDIVSVFYLLKSMDIRKFSDLQTYYNKQKVHHDFFTSKNLKKLVFDINEIDEKEHLDKNKNLTPIVITHLFKLTELMRNYYVYYNYEDFNHEVYGNIKYRIIEGLPLDKIPKEYNKIFEDSQYLKSSNYSKIIVNYLMFYKDKIKEFDLLIEGFDLNQVYKK